MEEEEEEEVSADEDDEVIRIKNREDDKWLEWGNKIGNRIVEMQQEIKSVSLVPVAFY